MIRIVLALILATGLFAASPRFVKEMGYESSYALAKAKAQEAKKPILLVVSTKTCPWCRKLEKQTLKKEAVNQFIQEHFIPVSLYKDDTALPKQFEARVVPTVYFIDPLNNEKAYFASFGYKHRKDFIKALEDAADQYKMNGE